MVIPEDYLAPRFSVIFCHDQKSIRSGGAGPGHLQDFIFCIFCSNIMNSLTRIDQIYLPTHVPAVSKITVLVGELATIEYLGFKAYSRQLVVHHRTLCTTMKILGETNSSTASDWLRK